MVLELGFIVVKLVQEEAHVEELVSCYVWHIDVYGF
jgi:hypothetical protein